MPIYEYVCSPCGELAEKLQKHNAPPPVCKQCDTPMKKTVSVSGFQLKGSGWAKDGYK